MKKLSAILFALTSLNLCAQSTFPLMVNTNGTVVAPTNFWAATPILLPTSCSPACATNTLYAFGDANTEGSNSSGNTNYTASNHLFPALRWPNVTGASFNWAMPVNNYSLAAAKMSGLSNVFSPSIYNLMGNLEWNWAGLACVLPGWNNLDAASDNDAYWAMLEKAHAALIARLLIDDYAGVGFVGWDHNENAGADGWVTTGTNNQVSLGGNNSRSGWPFTLYAAGTAETGMSRYRTALVGSQSLQFTKIGKRAVALFYETSTDGGAFNVSVNGVPVYSGNNQWVNLGGNDTGEYPQVVWLDNLPTNSIITLTANNGGGHFYFNA